jgi:hypothetical protein
MSRRATTFDPKLATFSDAARVLRVTVSQVRALVAAGHLRPHPILNDRISTGEISRFAELQSGDRERTETDPPKRRSVHDPISDTWDVPSIINLR